jgi:hypothetical protein
LSLTPISAICGGLEAPVFSDLLLSVRTHCAARHPSPPSNNPVISRITSIRLRYQRIQGRPSHMGKIPGSYARVRARETTGHGTASATAQWCPFPVRVRTCNLWQVHTSLGQNAQCVREGPADERARRIHAWHAPASSSRVLYRLMGAPHTLQCHCASAYSIAASRAMCWVSAQLRPTADDMAQRSIGRCFPAALRVSLCNSLSLGAGGERSSARGEQLAQLHARRCLQNIARKATGNESLSAMSCCLLALRPFVSERKL